MRLSGVVLAVSLIGAAAHAADDSELSDDFLEFLAEWDEEGETWLDAVGLEDDNATCDEDDDSSDCADEN